MAHWDEVWSKTTVQAPHDTVLRAIRRLRVRSVLEVGAGSGRDLEELGRRNVAVTYSDFSEVAVKAFQVRNPRTAAFVADARCLPFPDDSYDVAVSLGLIEHFEEADRQAILREKFRVSRRYVLVDVPQRYAAAYLIKKGLMLVGRWPYGEETEFSYGSLVAQVHRVVPQAAVVGSYGRELFPLPRNMKQALYRRLPNLAREAYISSHGLFSRLIGGSFGVIFEASGIPGPERWPE